MTYLMCVAICYLTCILVVRTIKYPTGINCSLYRCVFQSAEIQGMLAL